MEFPGLDRFVEDLVSQRHQIEIPEATCGTLFGAGRATDGMLPTINTMMVLGLVSLPGMMTGQILAGANPIDAVRYQIVIYFMLAGGTALDITCCLPFICSVRHTSCASTV